MNQDIEVAEAVIEFDEEKLKKFNLGKYSPVFLFTTENIKGMLQKIQFHQKDILTVSSSGDHVFNMLLCGAENIDTYDINVFTKYFFYLKEAAVRTLSYDKFLDFFFPHNRFSFNWNRSKVFSDELFWQIEKNIGDSEARIFWGHLFSKYGGKKIYHSNLFIQNYYSQNTYMECNNYLENEESYMALQQRLEKYKYNFCNLNIFKVSSIKNFFDRKYDFIYLSNILDSLKMKNKLQYAVKVKEILTALKEGLTKDGRIGVCYLYCYLDDYWYDSTNLKSLLMRNEYFEGEYSCREFRGISNLNSGRRRDRDALMVVPKISKLKKRVPNKNIDK